MEQHVDLEKLSLVGALAGAVVVLWRSYSSQIELNRKLTEQVTASTEVMRGVAQTLSAIMTRLDHMEEQFSSRSAMHSPRDWHAGG